MTENKFDISKIKNNDPLSHLKKVVLGNLRDEVDRIGRGTIREEILENHLSDILREYKDENSHGIEWLELHYNFEHNWHEGIVGARYENDIENIRKVVSKAITTLRPWLNSEIKKLRKELNQTGGWRDFDSESAEIINGKNSIASEEMKQRIAKFEEIVASRNNGSWERNLVSQMFREELTLLNEKNEKLISQAIGQGAGEKMVKETHERSLQRILDNLQKTRFYLKAKEALNDRVGIIDANGNEWNVVGLDTEWKIM